MKFEHVLFACTSLILTACMSANPSGPENDKSASSGVNNSDPRKLSYQDPIATSALAQNMKVSIAKKLLKETPDQDIKKTSLKKSATTIYVGFLSGAYSVDINATITLDDEDDGNQSQLYQAMYNGTGSFSWSPSFGRLGDSVISTSTGIRLLGGIDSKFNIIRTGVSSLPAASIDYAVFRMDDSCPSGSYRFARYFDNEDNNNANSYTGNIYPSYTENSSLGDGRTRMEFCFVPKDVNSTTTSWTNGKSVFAPVGPTPVGGSCGYWGYIITDDEDNNNANYWEWYGMSQSYIDRIANFMNGNANTHMTVNTCAPPVGKMQSRPDF